MVRFRKRRFNEKIMVLMVQINTDMRGYFNGSTTVICSSNMGAMQYQAQGKIGKFNQAVNERNAKVLEGQAEQIEQKAEFDIAQFKKNFRKIEGETKVALAKSGVQVGSGSAYNIQLSNAFEAELQKQLIEYNAKVAAANKMEEANFARISGQMARNQAKLAQISTVASNWNKFISNEEYIMPKIPTFDSTRISRTITRNYYKYSNGFKPKPC
jgi:hypothetical protein